MLQHVTRTAACIISLAVTFLAGMADAQEAVRPSVVKAQIQNGDAPYLVYGGEPTRKGVPLVVFLPGTDGTTANAPRLLLSTLADHGFRVIYPSYDNWTAGTDLCPDALPECFDAECRP